MPKRKSCNGPTSQNPDLNSIEHLWDAMEKKLADCLCSIVDELNVLLVETWRNWLIQSPEVVKKFCRTKDGKLWLLKHCNCDLQVSHYGVSKYFFWSNIEYIYSFYIFNITIYFFFFCLKSVLVLSFFFKNKINCHFVWRVF